MSHFFIVNVKVLVLIKWSHTPPLPQNIWKQGPIYFKHVSFGCLFLHSQLTKHHSNNIVFN